MRRLARREGRSPGLGNQRPPPPPSPLRGRASPRQREGWFPPPRERAAFESAGAELGALEAIFAGLFQEKLGESRFPRVFSRENPGTVTFPRLFPAKTRGRPFSPGCSRPKPGEDRFPRVLFRENRGTVAFPGFCSAETRGRSSSPGFLPAKPEEGRFPPVVSGAGAPNAGFTARSGRFEPGPRVALPPASG